MGDVTVRFVLIDDVSGTARKMSKELERLAKNMGKIRVGTETGQGEGRLRRLARAFSAVANAVASALSFMSRLADAHLFLSNPAVRKFLEGRFGDRLAGAYDKLLFVTGRIHRSKLIQAQLISGQDPRAPGGLLYQGPEAAKQLPAPRPRQPEHHMVLSDTHRHTRALTARRKATEGVAKAEASRVTTMSALERAAAAEVKRPDFSGMIDPRKAVDPSYGVTPIVRRSKAAQRGLGGLRDRIRNLTPGLRRAGLIGGGLLGAGALTLGIMGAIGAAGALLSIVGRLAAAIGRLVVRGVTGFVKMGVSAGMLREDTMVSLKTMLKSSDLAKTVYDSAVKMAEITPFQTTQVVDTYKKLLAYGFKPDELERTFTAIGDLAAVRGDPTAMQRLALVMGQIRAKGRLTGEEMMQLMEAGISAGDVYEKLGQTLGKSRDEIEKMQRAGEISSEVAIEAILSTIETTFGGAMKERAKTLSGLWSTIMSRGFELFNAAFEAKGGGIQSMFARVKAGAEWLRDALDPKGTTGKRIVGIINQIAAGFASLFGIAGKDTLSGMFDKMLTTIETILPYLGAFLKGFGTGFMAMFKGLVGTLGKIGDKPDDIEALADAFEWIGEGLGSLGAVILGIIGLLGALAALGGAAMGALGQVFLTVAGAIDTVLGKIKELIQLITSIGGGKAAGGGAGGGMLALGTGMGLGGAGYAGMMLPTPVTVPGREPAAAGGAGPVSISISMSGIGLDLDQLAARIRAEVKHVVEELGIG